MAREPIVFIVDDDQAMRLSTGSLFRSAGLRFEAYESAMEFLHHYNAEQPGCLVIDLTMPGMNGMDLVVHLRETNVQLPTIFVTGTGTIPLAVQGMKLGVVDFLEKPADPSLLLQKVRAALEQDVHRRADTARLSTVRSRLATLTHRERQILKLLVQGLSSKQVAGELKITVKTVENHRARLLRKTGALNAADLTRMAMLAAL